MQDCAPDAPGLLARRAVLRLIAAAPMLGGSAWAQTTALAFPDDCALLVGGPEDGRLADWGRLLSGLLQPDPKLPPIRQTALGGADGVTAANQFLVRVPRDGVIALLAPGSAGLAWLTGDPRAQFDAGDWLAVTAGVSPGVVACRLPPATLTAGARLRIAAAGPEGAQLPALLGAELLGLAVEPVYGLGEREAAAQALTAGAVDAVLVCGSGTRAHLRALAGAGAPPLFALGLPDAAGVWQRDRQMPELPSLPDLLVPSRAPAALAAAWRAVAVAAQLEYALVLPPLTPADLVAQWRRAGDAAAATPALRQHEADIRPLSGAEAQPVLAALKVDATAIHDLRAWLAARPR